MPTDGAVILSGFCVLFCFSIEKVEMEGTCSMYADKRNAYMALVGKYE
jgi:hypothetical protein